MPYVVTKDAEACSASKPWAVKKKGSSKVFGCHSSKADAEKQQAALYANTENSAARAAFMERQHLMRLGFTTKPVDMATMPTPEVVDESGSGDGLVLVTIRNVPLVSVGMEFPASTGPVTFDFGDLGAAALCAADPTFPRPRVKLGHTDPRFNDSFCPHCEKLVPWGQWSNNEHLFDGMPSFGFIEGMRLENGGAWLYGDLVDVPKWLASVMPVAYPSRSVEGWFGYKGLNDKEYKFAVTDLALLGVVMPGAMNLADLPRFYGAETPEEIQFLEAA